MKRIAAPPVLLQMCQSERQLRAAVELISVHANTSGLQLAPADFRETVAVHIERTDSIDLPERGDEGLSIARDPIETPMEREIRISAEGVGSQLDEPPGAGRLAGDD